MPTRLDFKDVKILEALGKYGPRNLLEVARKLGLPYETIRSRLKHLSSHFFLGFFASVYHTNLGLKKSVVFAEASPGHESLLLECLKANPFWIYVTRCFGQFEGSYAVHTIPHGHEEDFEQFLHQIEELGIARRVACSWSTCFQTVNLTSTWFDPQSERWTFPWEEWINVIPTERTQLPYTLMDPDEFAIKIQDYTDVFILKELVKDGRVPFVDIAKKLGVNRRIIEYHFRNHILGKKLIEGYRVILSPCYAKPVDSLWFTFQFSDSNNMAKFAMSLIDKPMTRTLAKELSKNSLFARLDLPREEFRKFMETLSNLSADGFLENYRYMFLDYTKHSQQTFSYEYFKNGTWIYDHKRHMQNLQNLVRTD